MQVIFHLENGKPAYQLMHNGKPVLLQSKMGFSPYNIPAMDSNFILLDKKIYSVDET
jgi:hypothetical protein